RAEDDRDACFRSASAGSFAGAFRCGREASPTPAAERICRTARCDRFRTPGQELQHAAALGRWTAAQRDSRRVLRKRQTGMGSSLLRRRFSSILAFRNDTDAQPQEIARADDTSYLQGAGG